MSVGLLVLRLKYDLYVVHLSKWFTFCLCFGRLVNVQSVVLPLAITHKYTKVSPSLNFRFFITVFIFKCL